MDFSKYKKVKQDKNSTTMQSDKGHTITLVHANMPRLQVEQLKRLKMGDGGRVGLHIPEAKKMADGGDPETDSDTSTDTNKDTPATNITINAAPAQGNVPAPQSPPSGVVPTAAAPVPYRSSNELPASAAQYGAHPVQFQSPEMKPSESNVAPNGTMDPGAVMRNSQTAVQNQQAIDETGAKANAVAQSGLVDALAQNSAQIANQYNEVKGHTDDYADYIRNHPIDAQNYLHSMSGGKKTSTGLALLLGGMKQGSIGGDNPASTWLNNQVTRDIDAQKANQTGQKNILDAYQHLYGEGVAATAATKASLMDLWAQKANQIALQLGTPQAAVNAQKFAVAAAIEKSKALQDAAVNLNALPGQGGAAAKGNHPRSIQQGSPGGGSPVPGGHPGPASTGSHDSILRPDAAKVMQSLMYTPKAKEMFPAIQAQYNNAVQADKALTTVHTSFNRLQDAVRDGGVTGYIRRQGDEAVGSIPYAGGPLKNTLNIITDSEANRAYEIERTNLLNAISGAFKGTNLGGGQIEEIAKQFLPELGDTTENLKRKEKGFKHAIKTHVDTSLLDTPQWKMIK